MEKETILIILSCICLMYIWWLMYKMWKINKEHQLMAKELKKVQDENKELRRSRNKILNEYNGLANVVEKYLEDTK